MRKLDTYEKFVMIVLIILVSFMAGYMMSYRISISPLELEIRGEQCDSNDQVKEFIVRRQAPRVHKVICRNGAVFTTGETE